jgi:hypothetical protein
MSKKVIIITAAAGLVSFAGAFVFAWLTQPSQVSLPGDLKQPALAGNEFEPGLGQSQTVVAASVPMTKAMTEQQLKNLVQDVREKMQEYNNRLQAIGVRERRLQLSQDVLKEDIENLENLRIELTSIIANFKSEQDRLLKSRLEIAQTEKTNLVLLAATYDKMEVASAGKILTNLCAAKDTNNKQAIGSGNVSSSFDDAVKILHYMTDRTKAKLLAELATSEPALAAALCKRLKQIVEGT